MDTVFESYLKTKAVFSADELEAIDSFIIQKRLRKRQYLLQEGDVWRYYAFVSKGCVRTYFVDERNTERIMKFSTENWWAGDRESLLNETPSKVNIDALEDSTLVLFSKQNFDYLRDQIPSFNEMVNSLVHRSYIAANRRIHDAISYTTEERYQRFIEEHADLSSRIPLHMIASYLGVTPETLSRIRALPPRKSS